MLVKLYVLVKFIYYFGWCFWIREVCWIDNVNNWNRYDGVVLMDFVKEGF